MNLFLLALSAATFFSVPGPDAPQLAPRGPYAAGVHTIHLVNPRQPDILHFDKATGKAPLYDRPLTVEVWYPAQADATAQTVYQMPMPGGKPLNGVSTIDVPDQAVRDAPPLPGKSFPLVVVSHGYPGSRFFMTYLTSNLASKGYVVAAIDHTDSVFDGQRGFASTLLNRSRDQLFTISQLPDDFLRGAVDKTKVAIIGYSMGGYGALTSGGAKFNPEGAVAGFVPGGYLTDPTLPEGVNLAAIVAIAPWGAQPPYSAWNSGGLSGIRIPSLFIAGSRDDVADYANGIKPAFEAAVHSERCLLTYDDARHNTGGNPAPPGVALPYGLSQSFNDPVWRKERITAINQHFITAFLDLYLKGDSSKAAYLHVQPAKSDDGQWPVPPLSEDKGEYSTGKDDKGDLFWKGFQRRSALGLEMSCQAGR